MDRLVAKAVDEISSRSGIQMEVCKVEWPGSESAGLRPSGIPLGRGFAIALNNTAYRAQALFIADGFAGPLLRQIGMRSVRELRWLEISSEGDSKGIRTVLIVNGEILGHDRMELPVVLHTLEIECSTRIPSTATENDASSLVSVGMQCLMMVLAGLDLDEQESLVEGALEGALREHAATRYERSRVNRMRCIRYYGTDCWVCDLSFANAYGAVGSDFIEVHHRVPLSTIAESYVVDPIRDLVPLCSNCHSMIHRRQPVYQPDELRRMIGKPEKELASPTLPIPE